MSFEEIRVITIVYLAVLLPLLICFTNKSKLPSWIPSFYIVSLVVCALGWELWFTYGWVDGYSVDIRRSEALNTWLPKNINWLIQVEGHTDNIPISTEQYPSNWELSTARAIAVAKIMMKNGVSSDKINVAGYGEHKPLLENNNSTNREKNRRIELKLTQP